MKNLKKPINVFFLAVLLITVPLCVFPINFFQGEIVYSDKLVEVVDKAPLSLSYFFGLGYQPEDMQGIKDFYLLPEGYVLAFIFTIGLPLLIAYRVHLGNSKKKMNG